MATLCMILTEGPWQTENYEIYANLAKAALEKGHQVEGFFYLDGVYNLIKHEKFPEPIPTPVERMKEIVGKGAKIVACGICVNGRGLEGGKEFIDGVKVGGLPDMADKMSDADVFICL